jgi:putative nucleotidyltransferase with HDIG domain
VFRFLTKPCPPEALAKSIEQSLRYYDFIQAERNLIDLKRWRTSLEQVVLALSNLVESRDPYTAGHQQRVALLSEALAKALGLDQSEIDSVKMAATIHDIGKIYVPIEFLNKPGTLSPLEFSIIQMHPTVGHEILKPIEFESPISDMVLQHHERLDGTGYPQGLSGEGILQGARIIAVADVVEAMCSHRPYRPSRGLDKARAEIEKNSSNTYDPEVVEACLSIFKNGGFDFGGCLGKLSS